MTTIAAELSIDSRGPCALYIASDSRITWGNAIKRWDAGQKAFASITSPDIFGYCGSAFFPTQIINQITRQIEAGILFDESANADERHGKWLSTVKKSLQSSPNADVRNFKLLHGAREGEGMTCTFRLWQSTFRSRDGKWTDTEIKLGTDRSYFASINGTGCESLQRNLDRFSDVSASGTSRHAFQTLFKSIKTSDDPMSGGAPQIVGMYRVGCAKSFGMIWDDDRYYCGCKLVAGSNYQAIDWFNELFERADGKTKNRLRGAKKHS